MGNTQHALAEILADARKGLAETARAGRLGVEDGVVQPALGKRRALLGEYVYRVFDLHNTLGLIGASGFLDGFDVEAHRFQRVEQEGIADGLHVVVEDLEDRLFCLSHDGPFEIAVQVNAEQALHFGVGPDIPLERKIDLVVYPAHIEPVFEVRHAPILYRAAEDAVDVTRLRSFQLLAHGGEWHFVRRGEGLKERQRRGELELPVVKLARDFRCHACRPRLEFGQQFAVRFSQPDELTTDREIALVNPETGCKRTPRAVTRRGSRMRLRRGRGVGGWRL